MKLYHTILLVHFVICAVKFVYAQQQNVTASDFGTLVGSTTSTEWTNKTIYQFLGVRYARSPTGQNRFKVC